MRISDWSSDVCSSDLALLGGVNIVVAMIGLFCIPVLIELVATPDAHLKVDQKLRGFRIAEAVDIGWKGKWNLLRSSSVGTVIGILPAAGGAIASLVAYAEARRASRTPERFGRGEIGRASCRERVCQYV